jgi:hypothetical protein
MKCVVVYKKTRETPTIVEMLNLNELKLLCTILFQLSKKNNRDSHNESGQLCDLK